MESCLSLRAALHRRLCSSAVFVTFDAVRVRVVTWSAVLVQAYSQRSDHLAVVAAYNGWVAARAAGGRSAGADFARQHFVSEQVRRLITTHALAMFAGIDKGLAEYIYMHTYAHSEQLQRMQAYFR